MAEREFSQLAGLSAGRRFGDGAWLVSCIGLFLLATPLLPTDGLGAHNLARLCQLPLLLICVAWLLRHPPAWRPDRRAVVLGVLLFSAAALSSALAPMPPVAAREVVLLLALAALAAAIAASLASAARRLLLTKWLIAAGGSYVVIQALIYLISLSEGVQPSSWSLAFGYDNPRFLNHVQAIAVPLLVGMANIDDLDRRWKAIAWLAAVVHLALAFATFGRSTLVALLLASAFALILLRQAGRQFGLRLLLVMAVGAVANLILFIALPSLLGANQAINPALVSEPTSDHSRMYLWRIAMEHIQAHPLLGIGPMHFAHFQNLKGAHPHNFYLQFAAEFGLPATVLLLALIGWALLVAVGRVRRHECASPVLAASSLCACIAALVDALFSGNFVMPASQVWAAVAVGIATACCAKASSPPAPMLAGRQAWLRRAGLLVLLTSVAFATAMAAFEALGDPPQIGYRGVDPAYNSMPRPRFWRQGWF